MNIIDRAKISAIRKDLVRLGFSDIASVLTMFKLGPSTFADLMDNYKDDRKIYINSDDFPSVQYKLQTLVMREGIKFSSDLDKMIAYDSVPSQFWQTELSGKNYRLSNIDLRAAKNLIEKKDFSAALLYLENVLKQDPNNFDSRFMLGRLLCNLDREDEGLVQIKWASRIKPHDLTPNLYITLFYALQNNWLMANNNLKVLEKKLVSDRDLVYLEDEIYARRKPSLNNVHIKNLMLKCHYPI
jgi:tetratricopeptide (TPR) repeat protein